MKCKVNKKLLALFATISFLTFISNANAYSGYITSKVNFRSGASTSTSTIGSIPKGTSVDVTDYNPVKGTGCGAGWININYDGKNGYVCASYIYIESYDIFSRPWTSPKKAIVGGAKYIGSQYINAGQYTSYLKKFNVTGNNLFAHQYMGNVRAPWSEAKTSFTAYTNAGIIDSQLIFSIPIYNNMNDSYALPGSEFNNTGLDQVEDQDFENKLNEQGFPESYKRRLRYIHKKHPNWIFESIKTNLDFAYVIENEYLICVIDGSNTIYRNNPNYSTEGGWYTVNRETAAYFLDPRNFIFNEERILQFEKLYYNDIYSEATVQAVLNNTFMSGISAIDNQSYASIFVEAGKNANVNPVYLASLSRQEVSASGSKATTGDEFTYKDITYKGLYNFYNIGAYASEASPVLAGLVWGSVGYNFANVVQASGNPAPTQVVAPEPVQPSVKKGDPNNDGKINSGDLLVIRQHLLGKKVLAGDNLTAADVNNDGKVNSGDLLRVRQHLLGTNKIS